MLLGQQTISQFSKAPYNEWYEQNHEEYEVDQETLKELRRTNLKANEIIVVLGTWCEDSHREFPRLMKILDELKYPDYKLKIIAVNHKKESPTGEEVQYKIQKVPTIILRKYGKEQGRIVESPRSGFIEKDLLEIVKKK